MIPFIPHALLAFPASKFLEPNKTKHKLTPKHDNFGGSYPKCCCGEVGDDDDDDDDDGNEGLVNNETSYLPRFYGGGKNNIYV